MAKTSYVQIPIGYEDQWLRGIKSGERFQFSKIVRNDTLLSKTRKAGISQRSMLPTLSALWQAFSDAQRIAWQTAAAVCGLKGWQLFVQDQIIRIKNEMAGSVTPVTTHQSWVGEILVADPASEIQIAQFHPSSYWVNHKVYGKKGMYIPLEITENFALPFQIGLSYKSNLTAEGADPYAKFYAKIKNSYQGVDDEQLLEIPLTLVHDWQTVTATLSSLRGTIIGYALYIHLHDLRGELYFDNIKAVHGGTNWARDPRCQNIDTTFTKAFAQIPKHWVALILPDGAEYDSVYKDF